MFLPYKNYRSSQILHAGPFKLCNVFPAKGLAIPQFLMFPLLVEIYLREVCLLSSHPKQKYVSKQAFNSHCLYVISCLYAVPWLHLFQARCIPGEWAPTCSWAQARRTTSGARLRSQASSWRTVQYWWRPAEGSTRCYWSKTNRRADRDVDEVKGGGGG